VNYVVENSLSLYEKNFSKLTDLLPGLPLRQGPLAIAIAGLPLIHIDILEQNPYTTTINISQSMAVGQPWVSNLCMKVRLYYDARVAEVIAYQGVRALQAFYPYPNPKMFQPYEKRRVNQFLAEWLRHCLNRRFLVPPQFFVKKL
jgi:uncharacterized protein YqiB (DUF1249 family)